MKNLLVHTHFAVVVGSLFIELVVAFNHQVKVLLPHLKGNWSEGERL